MKQIKSIILFIFCLLYVNTQAQQENKSQTSVQALIQSKQYTFQAERVTPLSGRQIQLTSEYTFIVKDDSLISNLPYYGRAYTAPLTPDEAGINFMTTDFNYAVLPAKRGRYTVSFKINNQPNAAQMFLSVSKSGYATLQVTPVNKQAISFNGVLRENKKSGQ